MFREHTPHFHKPSWLTRSSFREMEIQLLNSSLLPHPDAAIQYIRGPYTSRPAEIQINDRLLGLYPADITRDPVVIYDWKTGQMMVVRSFIQLGQRINVHRILSTRLCFSVHHTAELLTLHLCPGRPSSQPPPATCLLPSESMISTLKALLDPFTKRPSLYPRMR